MTYEMQSRHFQKQAWKGQRCDSPSLGPFPVHVHGLFKDTANQATQSREGARQGGAKTGWPSFFKNFHGIQSAKAVMPGRVGEALEERKPIG